MKNIVPRFYFSWLTLLLPLISFINIGVAAEERSSVNMPVGVTSLSRDSYDLHMLVIYLCVAIAVIVFGVLFWSLIRYRRSVHPTPAKFSHNNTIEVVWTIIPTIILVLLAFPAIKALEKRYDASKSDIDIKVTGWQWKWHYEYLKEDIGFFSTLSTPRDQIENKTTKGSNYLLEVDNELVVPVNKKIRILVTAADVIHSWWVPDFAVKQDAVPGYINEAWFKVETEGTYRGQCAELCGKDHGFMPVVVRAISQNAYASWVKNKQLAKQAASLKAEELASKTWTKDELITAGEKVYIKTCAVCHQPQGQGIPPSFPALAGNALVTNANPENPGGIIDVVLNGRNGTAMAAYNSQLSTADIAAVITYVRNSFGNSAEIVLPSQVK